MADTWRIITRNSSVFVPNTKYNIVAINYFQKYLFETIEDEVQFILFIREITEKAIKVCGRLGPKRKKKKCDFFLA